MKRTYGQSIKLFTRKTNTCGFGRELNAMINIIW